MPAPFPVEIELDGRTHHGTWSLKQGCKLAVGGFYGGKTVDLGEASTTKRAQEVLLELVLAWMAKRDAPKAARHSAPIDKPFQLTVLMNGRAWNGTWRLLGGQVFVSGAYGDRAASVGRSTPERVAERLLKALVSEWLERARETHGDDQHP